MNWKFRENSLDAIRLFAASEVAIEHTFEFMFVGKTGTLFFEVLKLFPGVPIFFFISGYLISRSYQRSPSHFEYAKNRILRLYPALFICVAVNIIMVASTGYLAEQGASFGDIALLFAAKTSFLQFYNPDFMRAFGDGVLNGSLWTICVELQFYILTPLLYLLMGGKQNIKNGLLLSLIVIFLGLNQLLHYLHTDYNHTTAWKLFRISFMPWFYMFLVGILFQQNFDRIASIVLKIPFIPIFLTYILLALWLNRNGFETGNSISPILFVLIIFVIFRAAYCIPNTINQLMRGNDISYGIYIWHMPVVNQMLYLQYNTEFTHAYIALFLSTLLALSSWFIIEKPALKLKSFTLNQRLSTT